MALVKKTKAEHKGESASAWIFQGSPKVFDIDLYLAQRFVDSRSILWTVRLYAEQIKPGDTVYLWRSHGKSAGIVAKAVVLDAPSEREDDAPELYLRDLPKREIRCALRLIELRLSEEDGMLVRSFCEIAVLAGHLIVKRNTGTNFTLLPEQAHAVSEVWDAIQADPEGDELSAPEGRQAMRLHVRRERSRILVDEAKARFQKRHGRLFCEACGFDFAKAYGSVGDGFIEAHHNVPVSQLSGDSVTRVSDLTMLCANCHRMIHRICPMSVESLREAMRLGSPDRA